MVPSLILTVFDLWNFELLLIFGGLIGCSKLLLLCRIDLPELNSLVISCKNEQDLALALQPLDVVNLVVDVDGPGLTTFTLGSRIPWCGTAARWSTGIRGRH